ncbi:hypothetical protein D0Z00_002849 [Geotrichum galactomycetum]|uniref:Uncharacterized protein n=1 Tax=Geotrichum galactomycetum TaxID=27317 RepID=A0ACB6V2Z1_9ASCO|nr:hypothetical protein D0Z00_002849 [Geotrichum candidum]
MKVSQLLFAVALTTASAQANCDPAPTVTVYKQDPSSFRVETVTITTSAFDSNAPQEVNQNNGNAPQQGGVVTVTVQKIVTHTATITVTHTPPPQTIVQTVTQKQAESAAPTDDNGNGVIVETTVIVDQYGNPITVQPDFEPTAKPQPSSQPTNNSAPASDNNNEGTATPIPVSSSPFAFFNQTSTLTNSSAPATANPVETITPLYTFTSDGTQQVISSVTTRTLTQISSSSTGRVTESGAAGSGASLAPIATSSGSSTGASVISTEKASESLTTFVTSSASYANSDSGLSLFDSNAEYVSSTSEASSTGGSVVISVSAGPTTADASFIFGRSDGFSSASSTVDTASFASTSSAAQSTSSQVYSTSSAESIVPVPFSTPDSSTSFQSSSTINSPSSTPSDTNPISSDPLDANSQIAIDAVSNHNRLRALHGVPDVTWNRDLAKFAQDYLASAQCNFAHSGGPYGENLAIGYPNTAASIQAWYDEIKDYDFSKNEFSSNTGHFTQVVWRDSTEIGCAEVDCGSGWGGPYLVCEYYARGNVIGWFEENVPRPLSG